MDRHRAAGSAQRVTELRQGLNVAKWISTSFHDHAENIDVSQATDVYMDYNPNVKDPNRPGFHRLEIVVVKPDGGRWRLYPQAVPIYEAPERARAIQGPADSRAQVLGRQTEINSTPELDGIGSREAEIWAQTVALPLLQRNLRRCAEGCPLHLAADALDLTDGMVFQWYRHFRTWGPRDRERVFDRPFRAVTECWLVLLGAPAASIPRPDGREHNPRECLVWLLRFQELL